MNWVIHIFCFLFKMAIIAINIDNIGLLLAAFITGRNDC